MTPDPTDYRAGADKAALLDHLARLDAGGHLRHADPAAHAQYRRERRARGDDGHDHEHDHGGCHCGGACDHCQAEAFRRGLAALRARGMRQRTLDRHARRRAAWDRYVAGVGRLVGPIPPPHR